MKATPLFPALAGAAAGLLLLVPALLAGLPQPMCVYYGQARDGYGLPYTTNAEVILLRGRNEVARYTIRGSLTPGVNFALYVHLDDGSSTIPYSARALKSGDLVSVVVRDPDGLHTIMEQRTVPPIGQPGELVLINATGSEDADDDGLPDTWEGELVAWSGGALQTIFDVRPGDDFDHDGMTNLHEYRAGTFAFLNYDYLAIESMIPTPNHRLQLTFLTVPGKLYTVRSADNMAQTSWARCPVAFSDAGALQLSPVEGTGDWLPLYVEAPEVARFFRLEVQ